ncbi:MAG: hypothetical protein AABW64_01980 [Nanoarchaeota archaeon]|mgnify:CR=1 FL=1
MHLRHVVRSLGLAGILLWQNSCTTPPHAHVSQIFPDQKSEAATLYPTSYEIEEVVPFCAYNPQITTTPISVNDRLFLFLLNGFDANDRAQVNARQDEREIVVKEYAQFREEVYREARYLGYGKEFLNICSPKEALEATCRIIARKTDYFARSADFEAMQTLNKRWEDLEKALQTAQTHEKADAEERERLKRGLGVLDLLKQKTTELQQLESSVQNLGGIVTYYNEYDAMSPQDLWRTQTGIVCRQYATNLVIPIFSVFKLDGNKQLCNTYVAAYGNQVHQWNQVVTLSMRDKVCKISASFFDPTVFDRCGDIEGFDYWHFNSLAPLHEQLCKATREEMDSVAKKTKLLVRRMR